MRVLSRRKLEGMVEYIDATEMPTMVVMPLIVGQPLKELVDTRTLNTWDSVLDVAVQISNIVFKAHNLPEHVLHRDIRPANIIYEGYYVDPDNKQIVLLDFDLSWFRGASGDSIRSSDVSTGYLAPEQIQHVPGSSTRNAAVDSFGIGMTLFFMISRRNPYPNEHKERFWKENVHRYCSTFSNEHLSSIPYRFARLIIGSTLNDQHARLPVSSIRRELSEIYHIILNGFSKSLPESTVEEIASRLDIYQYAWDDSSSTTSIDTPSGNRLELSHNGTFLTLFMSAQSGGYQERGRSKEWLHRSLDQVASQLSNTEWIVEESNVLSESISIEAHLSLDIASANISDVSHTVNSIMSLLARK